MRKVLNYIRSNEVLKNVNFVVISKGITVSLGLTTIFLSARGLTKEEFGYLAIFLSLIELFNFISMPGFNQVVNKSIHNGDSSFYYTAIKISLKSSFLLGLILLISSILAYTLNYIDYETFKIYLVSNAYIFARSPDKSDSVLSGLAEFKTLAQYQVMASLIRFITIGAVAYITSDLLVTIVSFVILQMLLSIWSYLFISKKIEKNTSINMEMVREGYKYSFLNIFGIGFDYVDRIVLASVSPALVGVYQAGISYPYKIKDVVNVISNTIVNNWYKYGAQCYDERMDKHDKKLYSIIFIIYLFMYLAAELYVPLVLGEKYRDAIPYAQLICISLFIKNIGFYFTNREFTFGDSDFYLRWTFVNRIIFLITLILLVRIYSIKGAVYAHILSEFLYIGVFIIKKKLRTTKI